MIMIFLLDHRGRRRIFLVDNRGQRPRSEEIANCDELPASNRSNRSSSHHRRKKKERHCAFTQQKITFDYGHKSIQDATSIMIDYDHCYNYCYYSLKQVFPFLLLDPYCKNKHERPAAFKRPATSKRPASNRPA